MSWQDYPVTSSGEEDFIYDPQYAPTTTQGMQQQHPLYPVPYAVPSLTPQQVYAQRAQYAQQAQQYQQYYQQQAAQQSQWTTPIVPSNYVVPQQASTPYSMQYLEPQQYTQTLVPAVPSEGPSNYLSPDQARTGRFRAMSDVSEASSAGDYSDASRDVSPNASEMARWGTRNSDGSWSCSHPACRTSKTFTRGCDLRKHYKRHNKTIFCRYEDCPASTRGGFSSNKDRDRHEARHNPQILCSVQGCGKYFSRVDNMRDHARRVHGVTRGSGRRGT